MTIMNTVDDYNEYYWCFEWILLMFWMNTIDNYNEYHWCLEWIPLMSWMNTIDVDNSLNEYHFYIFLPIIVIIYRQSSSIMDEFNKLILLLWLLNIYKTRQIIYNPWWL